MSQERLSGRAVAAAVIAAAVAVAVQACTSKGGTEGPARAATGRPNDASLGPGTGAAARQPAGPEPDRAAEPSPGREATFAGLAFRLPAGFTLVRESQGSVPARDGRPTQTKELVREYANARGQKLVFYFWDGPSPRELGNMVVEERVDAAVGGRAAKISRTSEFMSRTMKVLAAHFEGPWPRPHQYLVYTTELSWDTLAGMLAEARWGQDPATP